MIFGITDTPMCVSDPTQGYGVYVDWMLEEAGQV